MTTSTAPALGPTKQLEEALHAHFIRPEDRVSPAGAGAVYLTEVTAPDSNRRADVVHIGLWQNRGAGRIDVCELKTSRSDFLREIDQPAKAEAWWPYCTAFWLVVPHVSIAGPADMPPGWGLMVPSGRGRRFKVLVKPEERTPQITTALLLTLLKNTETTRTRALEQQRQELATQHAEAVRKLRRDLAGASDPKTRQRLNLLDQLEAAMGMALTEWDYQEGVTPRIAAGALIDYVAGRRSLAAAQDDLRYRINELDVVAEAITHHAAALRKAIGPNPAQEV